MTHITNYADLIGSMVSDNKIKAVAAQKAIAAEASARLAEKTEAIRPLVTVLRQAHEHYPNLGIHSLELLTEQFEPHIYTETDTSVRVQYSHDTKWITLQEQKNGRGYYRSSVLMSSKNVEDLIPPLIKVLANAVARKYRNG